MEIANNTLFLMDSSPVCDALLLCCASVSTNCLTRGFSHVLHGFYRILIHSGFYHDLPEMSTGLPWFTQLDAGSSFYLQALNAMEKIENFDSLKVKFILYLCAPGKNRTYISTSAKSRPIRWTTGAIFLD